MFAKLVLLRRSTFFLCLLIMLSLFLISGVVSAQSSPEEVARALVAAEDSHNVDAAVALFADDAVVTLPTGVFDTPDAIRGWQQELADGNFRIEAADMAVDGSTVSWDGVVSLDSFRNLGIPSMAGEWKLTIEDGKVETFDFTFTPEAFTELATGAAVATLVAAEAAHDVDAAVATFADNAVVTLADGSKFDTPEAIRGWQQALADGHFRLEPVSAYVDGNTVTMMGEISLDLFRQMGILTLGSVWKVTVEDGKITVFDFTFTPDALEALGAASS